ncbi:MAG TPA: hypothetical protein VFS58_10565 [Steroidobacteraceae bacterium]|nr:hypothetical protein [Steroidobacteraceae bacterium]
MSKLLPLFLVSGVVVAACAFAADKPATPRGIAPPTRIPDPVVAQTPAGERVDIASLPRGVRRAVVVDAARRFAVSENEVVLVNAERVTWSDGAMGCPLPGQMYTQMLVPGFRVSAKTSAGEMLYHTDSRGAVVNCAGGHFQTGPKQLPADPGSSGAGSRTQPKTPDR